MKKFKGINIYSFLIVFLIIISIITIIITKYNYNYENRTYLELKKNVVVTKNSKIDPKNEGKLVLVRGKLNYDKAILKDDFAEINVDSPMLIRVVEIYEWVESVKTKEDGSKSYKYNKIWANTILGSDNFHDKTKKNAKTKPIGSKFFFADNIKLGDFELTYDQKSKLPWDERINLKPNMYIAPGYKLYGNYITNSKDPDNPEIGDIRIAYYYYTNTEYLTILAVQSKNSFKDYITKDNIRINITQKGNLSFEKLMKKERIKKSS